MPSSMRSRTTSPFLADLFLSQRLVTAALIAAVPAVLIPVWRIPVAIASNAILIAVVFFEVLLAPRASDLQLRRGAPSVATLKVTSPVQIRLHNPTRRNLSVALRDSSRLSMKREPDRHRGDVAPGGWMTFSSSIRPQRRGYSVIGPVTVRTYGPLRLAGRQATLADRARMKVYPALPSRRRILKLLERARFLQVGEHLTRIRGGGTDFDSLREYHPDDEFRRINWRATARVAKPITNLYREERNQQVVLLMDAGRLMATSIGGISRFEHSIDAGIAVAELAARVGDHVGLLAFGSRIVAQVKPAGGRDQPRKLLDSVFDVEPALEAPNYRHAFATLLSHSRRRSLLVLLTELTEEAAMKSLVDALPILLKRHLVIVGSVLDPALEQMADIAPVTSEDAYLKASAADHLSRRAASASRLRGLGALVIDETPDEIAAAVADQYLRIKSFGRL